MYASLLVVPRASTTCRLSRTVGSMTHASMRSVSRILANASSPAVAVSARTCGDPSAPVRAAMRRLEQMVRLVDHDQRRPRTFLGEAVEVKLHELGGRADDVPRPGF